MLLLARRAFLQLPVHDTLQMRRDDAVCVLPARLLRNPSDAFSSNKSFKTRHQQVYSCIAHTSTQLRKVVPFLHRHSSLRYHRSRIYAGIDEVQGDADISSLQYRPLYRAVTTVVRNEAQVDVEHAKSRNLEDRRA